MSGLRNNISRYVVVCLSFFTIKAACAQSIPSIGAFTINSTGTKLVACPRENIGNCAILNIDSAGASFSNWTSAPDVSGVSSWSGSQRTVAMLPGDQQFLRILPMENKIRQQSLSGEESSLINYTNGVGGIIHLTASTSLAVSPAGKCLYVYSYDSIARNAYINSYLMQSSGLTYVDSQSVISAYPKGGISARTRADGKDEVFIGTVGDHIFKVEGTSNDCQLQSAAHYAHASALSTDSAVHPTGSFFYDVTPSTKKILVFKVSATTGALTTLQDAVTDGAEGIVITKDGKNLYATSKAANTINQFSIAPTGKLTALAPLTFAGLSGPNAIVELPSGNKLIVADSSAVRVLARSATTGQLSLESEITASGAKLPTPAPTSTAVPGVTPTPTLTPTPEIVIPLVDGSFTINNGSPFTSSGAVLLQLTAPIDATAVVLSNNPNFDEAMNFAISTQVPWTLGQTTSGNCTVYVRYTDGTNFSDTLSASIILDKGKPVVRKVSARRIVSKKRSDLLSKYMTLSIVVRGADSESQICCVNAGKIRPTKIEDCHVNGSTFKISVKKNNPNLLAIAQDCAGNISSAVKIKY